MLSNFFPPQTTESTLDYGNHSIDDSSVMPTLTRAHTAPGFDYIIPSTPDIEIQNILEEFPERPLPFVPSRIPAAKFELLNEIEALPPTPMFNPSPTSSGLLLPPELMLRSKSTGTGTGTALKPRYPAHQVQTSTRAPPGLMRGLTVNETIANTYHGLDVMHEMRLLQQQDRELQQQLDEMQQKLAAKQQQINEYDQAATSLDVLLAQEKLAAEQRDPHYWNRQLERLKSQSMEFDTKNQATAAAAEAIGDVQWKRIQSRKLKLQKVQRQRANTKNANLELERRIMEVVENINDMKVELEEQRESLLSSEDDEKKWNEVDVKVKVKVKEYPVDNTIIQNLILAQVEFYFSNYNLKRDKRLLDKINAQPVPGFLLVKDILRLNRIRPICTDVKTLYNVLQDSPFIDLIMHRRNDVQSSSSSSSSDSEKPMTNLVPVGKLDSGSKWKQFSIHGYVGRTNFRLPTEKEFPFRRTVFIYGLPEGATIKYLRGMLSPFGCVAKVQFDYGVDSIDRDIMRKMYRKPRVHHVLSKDSTASPMVFSTVFHDESDEYECHWCKKKKHCLKGYYHPPRMQGNPPDYMVCLQCAAARAEQQAGKYCSQSKLVKQSERRQLNELLLGVAPRDMTHSKTALCVFASQRQASKCVYVHCRIGYDGAFAGHYHHYLKSKKEIITASKSEAGFSDVSSNVGNSSSGSDSSSTSSHSDSNGDKNMPQLLGNVPALTRLFSAPVYTSEGVAVLQPHE